MTTHVKAIDTFPFPLTFNVIMVLVDSQKFACKPCIQGHRSSSCNHTDRPLFEVKKKGRPVSQCEMCRELRHSRRIHSKYACTHGKDDNPSNSKPSSSKTRLLPIVPALPHGFKDLPSPSPSIPLVTGQKENGLLVLARAAAGGCSSDNRQSHGSNQNEATSKTTSSCKKPSHKSKRSATQSCDRQKCHPHRPSSDTLLDLVLPPIFSDPSSTTQQTVVPVFPIMPPISVMTSLAGSGCTCGLECRCPGCVQHRGSDHASKDHKDCADGCGSCIDYAGGIELPTPSISAAGPSSSRMSVMDQFLTRAAALPRPSNTSHKIGVRLDPTDLALYRPAPNQKLECAPMGLPKLKCCGGRCGCLNGRCSCGELCGGDCDCARNDSGQPDAHMHSPIEDAANTTPNSPKSINCCCPRMR